MKEDDPRGQSTSSVEHDLSSRQTSLPAQDSSSWSGGSVGLGPFDFCAAPSDVSIPSFDPAIAAFADLSFAQQPNDTVPGVQPTVGFPVRDSHDKKRVKVESDTPALDSIDYWMSFDDELDKMGSFEIDYSKRPDLLNQNRPISESIPGLGSGLYNTATAPFRDEDFFDDSAFEQVLSDDEDMFESAAKLNGPSVAHTSPQAPQLSHNSKYHLANFQGLDKYQPGYSVASTSKDVPRQLGADNGTQNAGFDDQRRFLEDALNSGRIPAALLPPNGFGIGFGAGMGGCRPPHEFEKKSQSPRSHLSEAHEKPVKTNEPPLDETTEAKKPMRRPSAVRAGPTKKATGSGAVKARSADRIAHNDVERKYRTNLKDRIAELRAAVPTLIGSGMEGDGEGGAAGGQQGNAKISKGAVLTKATEYIHQLEIRNRSIMQEHQQLARRLQAFETLLNSSGRQTDLMMPNHSMTLFDPRGFC